MGLWRLVGSAGWCKARVHSILGRAGIQVFVQMNFGDAVVVQADGLANGILRNF